MSAKVSSQVKTEPPRVVILGAGYAGLLAALRLAGSAKRHELKVSLVSASDRYSERVRLHQVGADRTVKTWPLARLTRGRKIELVKGWVVALDLESRRVQVATDEGERELAYDYLLDALGSAPDKDAIPGVRDHAFALSDAAEAGEIAARLRALSERHGSVVVCGGGLTGIEAATEIAEAWPTLCVSIVTRDRVGAGLSEGGRGHIRKVFNRRRIVLFENASIVRVNQREVVREDGAPVPFDLCLWAGSFKVAPLAADAGLLVNVRGQILIDAQMRSLSHPTVFAAGDVAAFAEEPGAPIRMACATALPMGAHAADCLLATVRGTEQRPFRFRYLFQCVSLGRRDGLIQFVNYDDTPRERIITGRPAALIKEPVVRYTVLSMKLERTHAGAFRWLQSPEQTERAAARWLGEERGQP